MTKALIPTEMSNGQSDNTKPYQKSITQGLRTDLGRSVGVTVATQLVLFTGFTGPNFQITINKWENKSEIDDVCVFRVNAPTN